jgi:hypothetical protein
VPIFYIKSTRETYVLVGPILYYVRVARVLLLGYWLDACRDVWDGAGSHEWDHMVPTGKR